MTSRILAAVLAATLGLTSVSATPARAMDQDDAARLLLGITTLAIIAGALEQGSSSPPAPVYPPYYQPYHPPYHPPYNPPGYRPPPPPPPRPPAPAVDWRWLPAACQFDVKTRVGTERVLGSGCLAQNRVAVARLPQNCGFTIRTTAGVRNVFGARCLRLAGFRIEAR
jgi:hypothetical protein